MAPLSLRKLAIGNLNRLQGPSRGQHNMVYPIDGMILGHICGWSGRYLEQNVPIDLGPLGVLFREKDFRVWIH